MKALRLIVVLCMVLMGCQSNPVDFPSTSSSSSISSEPEPKQPVAEAFLISDTGIGTAQLGMTFQTLKDKLLASAQLKIISPFIVDFDAIAVSQSGQIQYYIVYPSGTTFADASVIELLLTDNPNYRTAESVSVGTSLKEAQTIYGEAILSYNTQSESREIVRFANAPFQNIIFLPKANPDSFVGIYPPSSAEYHETKIFNDSAIIGSIFVSR
jgi:hypothetical protein